MNTGARVRRAVGMVVAGLILWSAAPAMAAAGEAPTKKSLQALYAAHLKSEGIESEINDRGNVVFRRDGRTFVIDIDEKDTGFFCLALPNVWSIKDAAERGKILAAIDRTNAMSKAAKLYTNGNSVWISVEAFLERPEDFKAFLARAIPASQAAQAVFGKQMQ